jgi:ABC-type bacteriocin/lantibiotic exporter with double-glycine peptidase domain
VAASVALAVVVLATIRAGLALVDMARIVPTAERVLPILKTIPVDGRDSPRLPMQAEGQLAAKDVSFAYHAGDASAVDDVRLRVEPGQLLAIVGPSGSGKTTLLRLLLGLEHPSGGSVTYAGRPLADLDPDSWRQRTGVVLEGTTLFASDIRSNVGPPSTVSDDDIWRALEVVGLAQAVREMPMALGTFVAESGQALSRGQRQQILLARALVKEPALLVIDDATSELDGPSRRRLAEHLAGLDATRIVVSQDATLLRAAGRVVVMERGRIVQRGTPDELLGVDGHFRDLMGQVVV